MQSGSNVINGKKVNTNIMVKVSILAALAYLLTFLRIPLPLFPAYLKLDIAELPAMIAGFAFGPIAGVVVVFIRNILDFLTSSATGGVGELSNFIVGSSYVITASMVYKLNKSKKNAIIAVICAVLVMTMFGLLSNKYLIFPLYGLPADWGVLFTSILPFNIVKGSINGLVVILIYKKISVLIKG